MHYNKQLCTLWYTTASAEIAKGRVGKGGSWQLCNKSVMMKTRASQSRGRKVRPGFSLRRVGWAEGGAGGIWAAVVAEGAGTCGAAAVGSFQHSWLEIWVSPGVLHQVVAAHEALFAKGATELLLPRVGAVVAGQLIRAGELLNAVGPGAWERPFSCKNRGRASDEPYPHSCFF